MQDHYQFELCQRLFPHRPAVPATTGLLDEGEQICRMVRVLMQRLDGGR